MFQIQELIEELRRGNLTSVVVNGKEQAVRDAVGLKRQANGCIGTLEGTLSFELRVHEESDGVRVSFSFAALPGKTAKIGDITLFKWTEKSLDYDATERGVFEFVDSLGDQYCYKATDKSGRHYTTPMCLVYDLSRKESFFASQLTFDKNRIGFHLEFSEATGQLKSMRCVIPGSNYLAKEQMTCTDHLFIRYPDNATPYQILCGWADKVNAIYKPNIPEKIVAGFIPGTLISSKAETPVSQIRRQLNSPVVAPLIKLGMEYLWISISNLKDGLPGNWLVPNDANFPEGLRCFLAEVCSHGIKPGFWTGPFQICDRAVDFQAVKDFLIRKKTGELAERWEWPWGKEENGHSPMQYALDPADKRTMEYLEKVYSTYASWGIRYHMVDFLETGLYKDDEASSGYDLECYLHLMRQLRKFCHPETQLLSATGAALNLIGAVQSSRIGMDYGEGRPLDKRFPSYPANYVINGSFGSSGSPNRNAVNNLANWSFAHGRFFQCNSNMMTVAKPIPLREAQMSATLFGISPSPVFFGDDIANIEPERLSLIKKVLPRMKGMPEPVDLFRRNDGGKDFVRTFVLRIEKEWGRWFVCAVFNLNESRRILKLNAEELGLDAGKSYRMYDFWNETYCGIFKESREIDVAANSCALYRFEEVRRHPWILSTDIHVRQGEAELDAVSWNEATRTLSGKAIRTPGEQGNIFIIAEESFIPADFNRGLTVCKSAIDLSLIIKKRICFTQETEEWSVRFE